MVQLPCTSNMPAIVKAITEAVPEPYTSRLCETVSDKRIPPKPPTKQKPITAMNLGMHIPVN